MEYLSANVFNNITILLLAKWLDSAEYFLLYYFMLISHDICDNFVT